MLVNFINIRSCDQELLHQFSNCCKERIRYKKTCESCNKEVLNPDILKGVDKEHILSEAQQDKLKELLDNQTIEILSFEQQTENTLLNQIPFIKKTMLILPSISKGYKKRDVNIFLSFKEALKELNIYLKVKYITRGKEHLGIITFYQDDLIFIELPYFSYINLQEIRTIKEGIERENSLNHFESSLKYFAIDYVKQNIKTLDLELQKEKKAILIKQYLEQAINPEIQEQEQEVNNPFVMGG